MRFGSMLLAGALLLPSHVAAAEWSHSIARGLDLYQVSGPGVSINLICDPDLVYGSSNAGLDLKLGSSPAPEGQVLFRAGDVVLEATALRGRIGPEAASWAGLLAMLGTEGTVQIEYGGSSHSLQVDEAVAFSCAP